MEAMGLEPTNLLTASRSGLMWSRGDERVGAGQVRSLVGRLGSEWAERLRRVCWRDKQRDKSSKWGTYGSRAQRGRCRESCLAGTWL